MQTLYWSFLTGYFYNGIIHFNLTALGFLKTVEDIIKKSSFE